MILDLAMFLEWVMATFCYRPARGPPRLVSESLLLLLLLLLMLLLLLLLLLLGCLGRVAGDGPLPVPFLAVTLARGVPKLAAVVAREQQ